MCTSNLILQIFLYIHAFHRNFSFWPFLFLILREKQRMIFQKLITLSLGLLLSEERSSNIFLFFSKRSHRVDVESLTLKYQSFFIILKLSVLNYFNIKNRNRNNVINIVGPKSSSLRPLRVFLIVFYGNRSSNKVWWQGLLILR